MWFNKVLVGGEQVLDEGYENTADQRSSWTSGEFPLNIPHIVGVFAFGG